MFIVKYELIIINNVYCWLQMWKHSPWELTGSFFFLQNILSPILKDKPVLIKPD